MILTLYETVSYNFLSQRLFLILTMYSKCYNCNDILLILSSVNEHSSKNIIFDGTGSAMIANMESEINMPGSDFR